MYDEPQGRDEEHEPHHAQLAEDVEPLAVGVLDHPTSLAEAVVREGEGACPGADHAVVARLLERLTPEGWPAGVDRDQPARPFGGAGLVAVGDEGLHTGLHPGRAATRLDEPPGAAADPTHQHHQHPSAGDDSQPSRPGYGTVHDLSL